MRKMTTILCSIAFMVSGIMLAIRSPGTHIQNETGYKTIAAATIPDITFKPAISKNLGGSLDMPEDLVRDFAKQKGWMDTVYVTKTDTIVKPVTKVKWKKVPAPKATPDTVKVPVYYLATQVGNKEDPTGKCVSVYEVHKVDEICSEIINSSVELINKSDINVGE